MNFPDCLLPVLNALPEAYLVGGCVRDHLLGKEYKDIDIEVYGMTARELETKLRKFGPADLVGVSFGVIKLTLAGEIYDFSLPRDEVGNVSPALTLQEATKRRDLTINSLACNPKTGEILDYYGGISDLHNKILRHTSIHFSEDPLRVLRIMQFAARFQFSIAPETVELCRAIKDSYPKIDKTRIREEFVKLLTKGLDIKRGLDFLKNCQWLDHFPELKALDGCPQDAIYHPEGDVFTHTGFCCNALVELPGWQALDAENQLTTMLGMLCHDLGKPSCTKEEWKARENRLAIVSPGHDHAGIGPTEKLLAQLDIPLVIRPKVVRLVEHHMDHLQVKSDSDIRRLASQIAPSHIQHLALVIEADHSGRPPLPKKLPEAARHILERALAMKCDRHPQEPILMGRHALNLGLKPGPAIGAILSAAYEAQIRGRFFTLEDALAWFKANRATILENAKLGPPRLLDGKELQELGVPQGPLLGTIHRTLYEKQLDGEITTKEQAIKFVQDYLAT